MPQDAKLRIVAKGGAGERVSGKDTKVFLIHRDGSQELLTSSLSIQSVGWHVEGRATLATLVIRDVEIDAEASAIEVASPMSERASYSEYNEAIRNEAARLADMLDTKHGTSYANAATALKAENTALYAEVSRLRKQLATGEHVK